MEEVQILLIAKIEQDFLFLRWADGLIESVKAEGLTHLHDDCNIHVVIRVPAINREDGEALREILEEDILAIERRRVLLVVFQHQITVVLYLGRDLSPEGLVGRIGEDV